MDWITTVFSLGWEKTKETGSKVVNYFKDPETIESIKETSKTIGNKTLDGVIYVKDVVKDKVIIPVKDKITDEEFQQNVKDTFKSGGQKVVDGGKYIGSKTTDAFISVKESIQEGTLQEKSRDCLSDSYNATIESGGKLKKNYLKHCLCVSSDLDDSEKDKKNDKNPVELEEGQYRDIDQCPTEKTKNTLEEKIILEDIKVGSKTMSSTIQDNKSPGESNDVTRSQELNKRALPSWDSKCYDTKPGKSPNESYLI